MDDPHRNLNAEREAAFERWARKFEPTEEEASHWAEAERKRRTGWTQGPSDEEIREWAERTKWRRAYQTATVTTHADDDDDVLRYPNWAREAILASEGAAAWFVTAPTRLWRSMVRAGYAWEREWDAERQRSRRVPFPDEFDVGRDIK